jgi:hypothetical protein
MYAYRYVDVAGPTWAPLERIVARTVRSRSLPTLEADHFMYAGHLVSMDGRPDLHLYKHGITRCHLNVDDRYALYGYITGDGGADTPWTERNVYYTRHRRLADALEDLHLERLENAFGAERPLPENVVSLDRQRVARRRRSS